MLRCDHLSENYVIDSMSVETKGKTQISYVLGLQPCDKAAMLGVNTIEFFSEEFTWQQSLVPRGAKCFCSWPPTWQPWRHLQTSNRAFSWRHDGHIVVPKQWNSGHVGFSNQSSLLWELNLFLMEEPSFVPVNLYSCWPRGWKRSAVSKTVQSGPTLPNRSKYPRPVNSTKKLGRKFSEMSTTDKRTNYRRFI